MTIADRERLLKRIRQIRRSDATQGRPAGDVDTTGEANTTGDADTVQPARVEALETRVAHLEQLLEGLQDSVHRESERHAVLIAELQAQVEPAVMGAAIAEDARHRGL